MPLQDVKVFWLFFSKKELLPCLCQLQTLQHLRHKAM